MRILFVSFLVLICSFQLSAQQNHEFPAFKETPLREVLLYLESNFEFVFSYRDNNITDNSIITKAGNYKVETFLNLVFQQTNLEFKFINEKFIILQLKSDNKKEDYSFCGYVKDKRNGQLLPFANILFKNQQKGSTTSLSGRFELKEVKEGDTLIISYVGYQSLELIISNLNQNKCPEFELSIQNMDIPPVVVTVYLMDGILQDGHGQKVIIKPDKLSVFPGSVEPDIMTSIQILPGIFSADETASGLNIRGGTPDQNLVLYDGIPVYHTGHFFGMISAFNPYIVEEVSVYRSGMGSEFGGRVSGVIDIKSDSSIPDKPKIGLGMNMTHGHLNFQTPLWKKSAATISMRRSFTDFLPSPTFLNYAEKVFQGTKLEDDQIAGQEVENSDKFFFNDFNFKWLWNLGKTRFGIDLFSGLNNLDYTSEVPEFNGLSKEVVKLENFGMSLYWAREWNNKWSSEIRYTNSEFSYNYNLAFSPIVDPNNVLLEYAAINSVEDEGLNWINIWKPQPNHQIKFGYQFTDNNLGLELSQNRPGFSDADAQNFDHRLHTLFGEYHLSLANILDLDLGVRYQRQPLLKNDYFEPRVALTARINSALKLKLSSSKQFQFVSQLVLLDLNDLLFGNQIWIASNDAPVPVIESNQWTGGILFSKNEWQIDLEGYVKELAGITTFSSSFGDIPEQPFTKGNSRIRGIDVLVKKQFSESYRSWLSYTLSKAVYEFKDINEFPFPASHDQRHTLQWVHLVKKEAWEFALGWQFGSGLPYTNADRIGGQIYLDSNMVAVDTIPYIVFGEQNNRRLKPYHRLDASVMYHFGKKDNFSGFIGLSLVNIYNHQNTLKRQFLIENPEDPVYNSQDFLQINHRGLKFTPNIVLRLQW